MKRRSRLARGGGGSAVHSPVLSIMDPKYGNQVGSLCVHCGVLLSLAGNILSPEKPNGTRNKTYFRVSKGVPLVGEKTAKRILKEYRRLSRKAQREGAVS